MEQFDVQKDVQTIRAATYGLGTNDKKLLEVICGRPKAHLQLVRQEYALAHKGEDLVKLLEKETSGNFEKVLVAAVLTDAENRARFLHGAVKGAGTDEDAMIDCLMSASPSQIAQTRDVWNKTYTITFEGRVKLETSGHLKRAFEAVMNVKRPEHGVDVQHMQQDIDAFYAATEGKVGTNEEYLAYLVSTRSREHLLQLNEQYRTKSPKKKCAFEVLQSELSGDVQRAFCAAFMPASNWYAFRIHLAMKGLGTDEAALIRNVFLATPAELKQAAHVLQTAFKEDLLARVKQETSKSFGDAIVHYIDFVLKH